MIRIRIATLADIPSIARHRTQMFLEMGRIQAPAVGPLADATVEYRKRALPSGEYLGWMAVLDADASRVVGGAGVQRRRVLPFGFPDGSIASGDQAIVVNVFCEAEMRRKRVARALMETVIAWAKAERMDSLVLHASSDGRPLYESLGFAQTNEMRFVEMLRADQPVADPLRD